METRVTPQVSTGAVGLRYGLITGLVYIIFLFAVYATGQEMNTALGWTGALIPIVSTVLAQRQFRAQNGGYMSYGEGMSIGVLLSAVSGVLTSLFGYAYRTFIDPDQSQRMAEALRTKFEQAGNMSDAQIDQAVSMSQKFSSGPIAVVIGLVTAVLFGVVISLIVSAVMKHNRPEFE